MLRFKLLVAVVATVPFFAHAEETAGVIIPLSGGAASYGKGCINGVELAQKEFNVKSKFSIAVEDDQNTPAKTLLALKSIRQKTNAKIFLTWASNTSLPVSGNADREGFIQIAAASDPAIPAGKKNVFNYWVAPEEEVKTLVAELKRRGLKKIAIVSGLQEALLSFKKYFVQYAPESGIEIVFDEEVGTDTKDFKTLLTKIRALRVDGLFDNVYVEQTGILAKQARALGIKSPIFSIELFEDLSVVDLAQGALEGQFYVTGSDGSGEFIKRYKEAFPGESLISAANCYDFVGLLASAPSLEIDALRTYLENLKDFKGAVGKSSATGDHRFSIPAVVKVIKGREFIPLN